MFIWTQEQEEKDDRTSTHRTLEDIGKMASDLINCLRFTWDTPEHNHNGRMPLLDTKLWVDIQPRVKGIPEEMDPQAPKETCIGRLKKIIMFSFFRKPMASRTNNLNRAGLPESTKVSTAVDEIHRHLKNTSRELPTP